MKGAHKTNDLRRWYGFFKPGAGGVTKEPVERGTVEFFGLIHKGLAL